MLKLVRTSAFHQEGAGLGRFLRGTRVGTKGKARPRARLSAVGGLVGRPRLASHKIAFERVIPEARDSLLGASLAAEVAEDAFEPWALGFSESCEAALGGSPRAGDVGIDGICRGIEPDGGSGEARFSDGG